MGKLRLFNSIDEILEADRVARENGKAIYIYRRNLAAGTESYDRARDASLDDVGTALEEGAKFFEKAI